VTRDGTSLDSGERVVAVDRRSPLLPRDAEGYLRPGPWTVWLEVEGMGPPLRVADTGYLAEYGVDYDLLFDDYREAVRFGVQTLWVCFSVEA